MKPLHIKPLTSVLLGTALVTTLAGCVVASPGGYPPAGVVVPAGVAYVGPTYAVPGPGYAWAHNPRYGWGWRHPSHGWHRGWR